MQTYTENSTNPNLEETLEAYATSLEISETRFKQAETSYNSIGEWLNRAESKVRNYKPKIYTQGSFCLGTVIKPENVNEHYDIDLVCELSLSKNSLSQEDLKSIIGKELEEYVKSHGFKKPLEEGKRCWSINYTDEAQFHVDILPAVPETDEIYRSYLYNLQVPENLAQTSICITDKTDPSYSLITNDWQHSNPKGYANWFRQKMQTQYEKQAQYLLTQNRGYRSIEEVPLYRIKTPLQKAIQLLKRHRDVMFANDSENKPASIIFTTIAADAYENQESLYDTLLCISNNMGRLITSYPEGFELFNPVRPDENFTDRWKNNSQKKSNFYSWVIQLEEDVKTAMQQTNLPSTITSLGRPLGINTMEKVLKATESSTYPRVNVSETSKPWSCND